MSEEHKYDFKVKRIPDEYSGLFERYLSLKKRSEDLSEFAVCEVESEFFVGLRTHAAELFEPLVFKTQEHEYLLGSGLHAVIGSFESGKSTMVRSMSAGAPIFYSNEVFDREVEFGASNVSMDQNLVEIFIYLDKVFKNASFAFVDSLRCVFSFNKRGYAKGGLAIGPFDFFDNLDKLLKKVNRGLVCVIPIDDDRLEHREMFFSMMSIRVSSCIMPYAVGNLLNYAIRRDLRTNKRITRTSEALFANVKL